MGGRRMKSSIAVMFSGRGAIRIANALEPAAGAEAGAGATAELLVGTGIHRDIVSSLS